MVLRAPPRDPHDSYKYLSVESLLFIFLVHFGALIAFLGTPRQTRH